MIWMSIGGLQRMDQDQFNMETGETSPHTQVEAMLYGVARADEARW